ncbi:hypothetical protein ACFL5A_02270, partial [Gemmatimonadota bacterium]
PLAIGWDATDLAPPAGILPSIEAGAMQLQEMVDAFNALGLDPLESEDLVHLVVDPRRLFEEKVEARAQTLGAQGSAFREAMTQVDWEPIAEAEGALMDNPYTVHQVLNFMDTAPLMKVYALVDGEVTIRQDAAAGFAEGSASTRLSSTWTTWRYGIACCPPMK